VSGTFKRTAREIFSKKQIIKIKINQQKETKLS